MLKDKIVINDALIASNILLPRKISQQYCPLTFTPMLGNNNSSPIFDTMADTMAHLVRVTYCRMLCFLPGPVLCTQSIVLAVKVVQL